MWKGIQVFGILLPLALETAVNCRETISIANQKHCSWKLRQKYTWTIPELTFCKITLVKGNCMIIKKSDADQTMLTTYNTVIQYSNTTGCRPQVIKFLRGLLTSP